MSALGPLAELVLQRQSAQFLFYDQFSARPALPASSFPDFPIRDATRLIPDQVRDRERIYFEDDDDAPYLDLPAESKNQGQGQDLDQLPLARPSPPDRRVLLRERPQTHCLRPTSPLHRKCQFAACTTGHMGQGRHVSVVMDEQHLFHASHYVSLKPGKRGQTRQK